MRGAIGVLCAAGLAALLAGCAAQQKSPVAFDPGSLDTPRVMAECELLMRARGFSEAETGKSKPHIVAGCRGHEQVALLPAEHYAVLVEQANKAALPAYLASTGEAGLALYRRIIARGVTTSAALRAVTGDDGASASPEFRAALDLAL